MERERVRAGLRQEPWERPAHSHTPMRRNRVRRNRGKGGYVVWAVSQRIEPARVVAVHRDTASTSVSSSLPSGFVPGDIWEYGVGVPERLQLLRGLCTCLAVGSVMRYSHCCALVSEGSNSLF